MRKAVLWGAWTLSISVTLAAPRVSLAQQGDVAAAAASFARAQEAEARGDHMRAAGLFELADRISPAPASLRNATRARMAAGQLVLAAGNAEELKRRYPDDKPSVAVADEVLSEARQKLARVSAQCTPICHVVVDGLAASAELRNSHVLFVEPGAHALDARFEDGTNSSERISATAGQQIEVKLSAPAAPPAAAAPSSAPQPAPAVEPNPAAVSGTVQPPPAMDKSHGWSPVVGLTLGAVALVVSGVAAWSAIDTHSAREDFEKNPTREAFDDGEAKDLRTNVLIGAGAIVGLISVSVLAFGTDWSSAHGESRTGVALRLGGSHQGARVGLEGCF